MSKMDNTQSIRITSDTGWPFAAYTHLPVRQEMLSREMMRGITGGTVLLPSNSPPPVLPGVAAMGDGAKIMLTSAATLATSLIVKYSDQILNGVEAAWDRVAEAFTDVWHWATH